MEAVTKDVGRKLLGVVVWTVISLLLSYVVSALSANSLDGWLTGGASAHEAAVAGCVVLPKDLDVTLADVGGLEGIKDELYYSLLLPLRYPKLFFRPRGPFASTKGVLLTGPPGCGKTMLMKAVAKTCGCAFLAPTLATLQNKYYGESQKLLAALFAVARKKAPCIVFLDEVDSAFRTRGDDDSGCDYTLKTEFLSLMDGLRTKGDEAIVVVGATNNPDALDPALKRRLPTVLTIGLPTAAERHKIVALACREEPAPGRSAAAFGDEVNASLDGCSGSDLVEVYKAASRLRLRELLGSGGGLGGGLGGGPGAKLPPLTAEHWAAAAQRLGESKKAASVKHCAAKSRVAELVEALKG